MAQAPLWTPLHAQVHRTLRRLQLLPKRALLLVAVSGGQDSLCLLRLLLDLQPKWGWQLGVAHCNHGWRADAGANAAYVRQLAATWQLAYHEATASTLFPGEAEARKWRYQALAEIAQIKGYGYVATGHTASDRAETLLLNLLRGSGADGLQALAWQRELVPLIQLVRPLLGVMRAETGLFCQQAALTVWEDSTNRESRFARNRVRQTLIPYLQTHFNAQVEQALAQTAELLRSDVEYLEAATQQLWTEVICGAIEPGCSDPAVQEPICGPEHQTLKLNRIALRAAPIALQRRVLRRFLQTLLPAAPTFAQIEKLMGLLHAPNRSQTDPFPGGAIAQVQQDWIVLWSQGQSEANS
ncbi:MAG: tRNA lysidine(34) synthetase TilS [Elainella sp.]